MIKVENKDGSCFWVEQDMIDQYGVEFLERLNQVDSGNSMFVNISKKLSVWERLLLFILFPFNKKMRGVYKNGTGVKKITGFTGESKGRLK